ncbi:MAG: hypothetical protein ACOYLE_06885 [Bacteroidales bacterium]
MITLDFKGPYHFDNIQNAIDIDKPGIYIWGFTAKRNKNGNDYDIEDFTTNPNLIKPDGKIDFEKDQLFIPYYVGIASGNSKSICDRINEHYKISGGDGPKKTRLTKGYLKPIKSSESLSKYIIKALPSTSIDISYFNNQNFLFNKYNMQPYSVGNNYPINVQISKGIPIFDSLDKFINKNNYNNFSFLYCPIENNKEILYNETENNLNCLFHQLHFKTNLSYLESFVFYSLKGITISNCHVLDTVKNEIIPNLIQNNVTSLIKLSAPNCNDIFKFTDAVSFKERTPSDFPCDY